jgi:hypothetical protein
MAAEAQQQARVALADEVERVAQMERFDRPPRSFQRPYRARTGSSAGAIWSFRREAILTTPSWNTGRPRACRLALAAQRERAVDCASASWRMPASSVRRSRFIASSNPASLACDVLAQQALMIVMSASWPAAFRRGLIMKLKSAVTPRADRVRRSRTAPRSRLHPPGADPLQPCATRQRLLRRGGRRRDRAERELVEQRIEAKAGWPLPITASAQPGRSSST